MNFEIVERIETKLAALASGAPELQSMHWIRYDDTGDDSEESYCEKCANLVAEWYCGGKKPANADAQMLSGPPGGQTSFSVCGTLDLIEDDEPRLCDLCSAELAVSILTGDSELDHWETYAPEAPEDWRILGRLLDTYTPHLLRKKPYVQRPSELQHSRERAARLMWILRRYLAA